MEQSMLMLEERVQVNNVLIHKFLILIEFQQELPTLLLELQRELPVIKYEPESLEL